MGYFLRAYLYFDTRVGAGKEVRLLYMLLHSREIYKFRRILQ